MEQADVIVIGGGVAGLSTALQLAARQQKVTLLERNELASGATSRASGLLGQLRSNVSAIAMLQDCMTILHELEAQTGVQVCTRSGSVRVASSEDRAEEIRRAVAIGQQAGLDVEMIEVAEVQKRMDYMRCDDLIAACYCASDGYLNPPELAQLYITVARQNGVDLRPHTPVEAIEIQSGKVQGVRAGGERFAAPVVVNAAGPWSYLLAELADQQVPTAGIGHAYFTFGPAPHFPIDPLSPTCRDRENLLYTRPTREGGVRIGIYETEPVLYEMATLPANFQMRNMEIGREHPTIQALLAATQRRFPTLPLDAPLQLTTGIMSWTPDGNALCGPLPDVEGLYHCIGFCGHGVMQSPAIGRLMAEWITEGTCRYDLHEIASDRYYDLPTVQTRSQVEAGCLQAYRDYYSKVDVRR